MLVSPLRDQQTIFGFATLVREDLIEHSIGDSEVIATYGPATAGPPSPSSAANTPRPMVDPLNSYIV